MLALIDDWGNPSPTGIGTNWFGFTNGEQVHFYYDADVGTTNGTVTLDVDIGDIAYWPEGKCLCVFFGSTPVSSGDKPVPASEVVIVGKADIDPEELRKVAPGDRVVVE